MSLIEETKKRMMQTVEHLKKDYQQLRSNRVHPQLLDSIKVEVYGSQMTIKSLATVTVQDRTLVLTPFDPSIADMIAKAILQSPLNLNAIREQNIIRVPVPPLNEDLRKDIAKQAKQKTESAKILIRNTRRDSNESIRKQKSSGEISEDEQKKCEKQIQELTDSYCKELDLLYVNKEKEIMTV